MASRREIKSRGLKSVSYSSSLGLSVGYDSRMQLTSFQLVGENQTLGADYQYYDDGKMSYSHDLSDSIFDRSYSYDQLGRLTASYSGSEARGESVPDGPYRQTYDYDTWGNLTQRTGRDWTHTSAPVTFPYDNATNRNPQWQYDAEGNVISQGARHYSYDAAGRQISTSQTSGSAASQVFDGDGFKVKRTNPGWVGYYVRSSALAGEVIAELDPQGQPFRRNIYSNGQLLAQQDEIGYVRWMHRSPSNNTEWSSSATSGNSGGSTSGSTAALRTNEFDPTGASVGTEDPYLDGGGYSDWTGGSGVPSDLTTGCSWQGMAIGCQYAVKIASWHGGNMQTASKTIPGVGHRWSLITHVMSRVIGDLADSGVWSEGDITFFKGFVSEPNTLQASVARSRPGGKTSNIAHFNLERLKVCLSIKFTTTLGPE